MNNNGVLYRPPYYGFSFRGLYVEEVMRIKGKGVEIFPERPAEITVL